MLRRPLFSTVEGYRSGEMAAVVEPEPDEAPPETPDRSHVAPPPSEPAPPRDEAMELVDRRLDVLASRADRLERSVEGLSPVRIADMPTRPEFRSIEERVEANRARGESLARQLAELTEMQTRTADTSAKDRATVADLATAKTRLDERLRDLAEEVADLRQSSASVADSISTLRDSLADREAIHAAAFSQRLAGAYTLAFVALLAAILTLALHLMR